MKRLLFCLLLLVALLAIATAVVSAQRPIPNHYSIVVNGPCWLPDGRAAPEPVLLPYATYYWTKPRTLVVSCNGWLPRDAPRPKVPIKLTFDMTGYVCEATFEGMTYLTAAYGAVVYPSGRSEIACRFDLSPVDP